MRLVDAMVTMLKMCFLFILLSSVAGKIPDGYIMDVTVNCGSDTSSEASVTVVTDLVVDINALCAGNNAVNFTTVDGPVHVLNVSYPGVSPTHDCVFWKRVDVEVYAIQITLAFGDPGSEVYNDEELRTVTCTFDVKGEEVSDSNTVQGRVIAPFEVQANNGAVTQSALTLRVVDIRGDAFNEKTIDLGRKIRLMATTDGLSGEQGLRITACDAIGSESGRKYQIIRAGCGDGIVFEQDAGFVTTNLTAMSPVFKMFCMWTDPTVTFQCNYTLCENLCDGSACDSERRRKRAVDDGGLTRIGSTVPDEGDGINLEVTNVGGFPTNDSVLMPGRQYRILITTDGSSGEVGLTVNSCNYISRKRTRPPISGPLLKDGCGLQSALRSSEGFSTTGLKAISDTFYAFNFRGDRNLTFQCEVTLCMETCDGHSCSSGVEKREAVDYMSEADIIYSATRLVSTTPNTVTSAGGYHWRRLIGTNLVVFR